MASTVILLKLLALILFCITNFFASLEAVTLYTKNTSKSNAVLCINKEKEALLKFKASLEDPSGFLSSWVGPDCCKWRGVICNNSTGKILNLDLRNPECYREFDKCLSGKLTSTHLNELQDLSYLDLSYNSFYGMIPPGFGNLSKLYFLNLNSLQNTWVSDLNWLSGLSSLEILDLSFVNLTLATMHWLQALNSLPSLSQLYLYSTNLHNIPVNLPHLNFTSLSVLDLSYNNFSTQTPQWLFDISSVEVLDLSGCYFKGPISTIVQGLGFCSFRQLYLSQNEFSGGIDELVEGSSSLCVNNSLERLFLSSNKLSGQLPNSLGHLKSLRQLDLRWNSISGPLPYSIGELLKLETLYIGFNKMNGSIPESLGKLEGLQSLYLLENDWEGILLQNFFQLHSKLKSLAISSSNTSFALNLSSNWVPPFSLTEIIVKGFNLGPKFPEWLQTQTQIETLVLQNVNISEPIPNWFWKMSPHISWLNLSYNQIRGTVPCTSVVFPSDTRIDLSYNSLEGPLPLWPNVSFLNLANNSFSGPIPSNIGQIMSKLANLYLSWNLLNGSIPSSLGNISSLSMLHITNNHLSGEVHDNWMGERIEAIDLSLNNLSGNIPASLCSLPNLSQLKLSNNKFSGKLPSSLKNCKNLTLLDFGGNRFSGSIPEWVGESLSSLQVLSLQGNLFDGRMSTQFCHLQQLHALDLSQNNLSGPIPSCLSNITAMTSTNKAKNKRLVKMEFVQIGSRPKNNLEMKFVLKGIRLKFDNLLPLVKIMDLSLNNLSGSVPEDITNLFGLGTLNLSNNHLTGKIPQKIGELRNLETCDLSSNQFSGQIPSSMSLLTYLSHLNLSYNNLSGPIPTGNQFNTFEKSIYVGNPGLCGDPLPKECKKAHVVEEGGDHDEDENEDKLGLIVSIAFGFVVGFGSLWGSLIIKKSWRISYFRFLNQTKDWIFVLLAVNVNHLREMTARNKNP